MASREKLKNSQELKEININSQTRRAIAEVRMLQKTPGISFNLDESFTQEISPLKNLQQVTCSNYATVTGISKDLLSGKGKKSRKDEESPRH